MILQPSAYFHALSVGFDRQGTIDHHQHFIEICHLRWFAPSGRRGHMGEAKRVLLCMQDSKMLVDDLPIVAREDRAVRNFLYHMLSFYCSYL